MQNNFFDFNHQPIGNLNDYTRECIERVESYFFSDSQKEHLQVVVPTPEEVKLSFNVIRQANLDLCDIMFTSYMSNPSTHEKLHDLYAQTNGPFFVPANVLANLGQPSCLKCDFSVYGVFYHGQAKVTLGPQLSYDASSARTKLSISLDVWFDKMRNKGESGVGGSVSIRRKNLEGKFAVETDLSFSELKDNFTFQMELPDTGVKVGFQLKNQTVKQAFQPSEASKSSQFVASGDIEMRGVNVNLGGSTFLAEQVEQEQKQESESDEQVEQEQEQESKSENTKQLDEDFPAPRRTRHTRRTTEMRQQIICPEPPAVYTNCVQIGSYSPLLAAVLVVLSFDLSIQLLSLLERGGVRFPFWISHLIRNYEYTKKDNKSKEEEAIETLRFYFKGQEEFNSEEENS